MKHTDFHEFGTNIVRIHKDHKDLLDMNGRKNLDDQLRDLSAVIRHHERREHWLILQMSDEELDRLKINCSDRNADDWFDRVMHRLDEKVDTFIGAHKRLTGGGKDPAAKRGISKLLAKIAALGDRT